MASKSVKAIYVVTGKLKDNTSRRIIGYFARFGNLEETGVDQQTAIDRLISRLNKLPGVCGNPFPVHRSIVGFTLILIPEDGQTRQYIVCPDGHVTLMTTPELNLYKVEDSARLHIAQRVFPDRARAMEAIRGWQEAEHEFASWAEFQDRYRQARSAGYSDVEAHDFAGHNPGRAREWFDSVASRIQSTAETNAAIADMRR